MHWVAPERELGEKLDCLMITPNFARARGTIVHVIQGLFGCFTKWSTNCIFPGRFNNWKPSLSYEPGNLNTNKKSNHQFSTVSPQIIW